MNTVIMLAVVLFAETVMAQCIMETTFLPDGSVQVCQVCNYGGQIIRTCY